MVEWILVKKDHAWQSEQQFRQGSEFAWILSGDAMRCESMVSAGSLGGIWFISHGLSANEQYFSLTPNQSTVLSLPETPKLPSVPTFAVGKISDTRQTWCLPSVPKTTLGNNKTHGITVYAECLHSANNRHTATSCPGNTVDLRYHFAECHTLTHGKPLYAECQNTTLGKRTSKPSVTLRHSANSVICRVSPSDTRQTIFFYFAPQTFCTVVLQYLLLCVEVLYISGLFYYISSIYFSQMNFR